MCGKSRVEREVTDRMAITFAELLVKRRGTDFVPPERLLCLDPGETTGWSVFENGKLTAWGQAKTLANGWSEIDKLFTDVKPTMVIYENYRVYSHKLSRHENSEVYTLRLVGVIEFLCEVMWNILYYNQMAHQAKGFVSDDKLKQWGMYQTGQKHARDSIRHGIYFLLFDKNLGGK
ncbi:hypothetical protein D3C74_233310 [compost metagenome]